MGRWLHELEVALSIVLYLLSVYPAHSTFGQRLLNLQYASGRPRPNGDHVPPSRRLKMVHILLQYILPYGWTRVSGSPMAACRWLGLGPQYYRRAQLFTRSLEKALSLASFVNLLIFLAEGKYASLVDRFLGLRLVLRGREPPRNVSYQFLSRELLWHGFAEFLVFVIPLINVRKIKTATWRGLAWLWSRLGSRPRDPDAGTQLAAGEDTALCRGRRAEAGIVPLHPVLPRVSPPPCGICSSAAAQSAHTVPCGHIFCYYCISIACLSDGYECPVCFAPVSEDSLRRAQFQPPE